jgi:asparagine N-glycosylation enzyme membrane subunit Stt3
MFASRTIPTWDWIYPAPGDIRFFDTDPYYHLRHTQYAAEHFPHVQRFDRGVYPIGTRALYAGLFDVVTAGVALVAGGFKHDEIIVTHAAVWMPVVYGLLCLGAVFWLATLAASPWAGALAAVFVLFHPGTFVQRSILGGYDHHIVEVLLGLLIGVGLIRALQRERERPLPWWRPAFLTPLPLAILLYTWYGGPIYVVLAALTLFIQMTFSLARGEQAAVVGRATFRFCFGLLLMTIPVALVWPWMVMDPWKLVVTVMAIAVLGLGLPGYGWLLERLIARGLPRVATAIGGLILVVGGIVVASETSTLVFRMMRQLLGEKTELVTEQFAINVRQFFTAGGAPAVLGLISIPLVWFHAWRRPSAAPSLMAAVMGTLLIGLWLQTNDYNYLAGPWFAVMGALTVAVLARGLRSTGARVAAGLALAAALVVVQPWVPEGARAWPPQRLLSTIMIINDGWVQGMKWMRASTPPLEVPLQAPRKTQDELAHPPGNYGVINNWSFGHFINAVGQRPPVAAGGHHPPNTAWFLINDEAAAEKAIAALGEPGEIRYVIVEPRSAGEYFAAMVAQVRGNIQDYIGRVRVKRRDGTELKLATFNERYRGTMVSRLFNENGVGLGHYRMVYASPAEAAVAYVAARGHEDTVRRLTTALDSPEQKDKWRAVIRHQGPVEADAGTVYDAAIEPQLKIFEHVRGARLVGQAPPGTVVAARIMLRGVESRYAFAWTRSATADAAGRYEIVAPYASQHEPISDVAASGPYIADDSPARASPSPAWPSPAARSCRALWCRSRRFPGAPFPLTPA